MDKLTFHKGIDYACVMTERQTTENPLAMLYGIDRDVTRFGKMFAAAPDLLAAAKRAVEYLEHCGVVGDPDPIMKALTAAITAATS